jgi:hypothetical protein
MLFFMIIIKMEDKTIHARKEFCSTIQQEVLVFEGYLDKEFIRRNLMLPNLYTFCGRDSDGAFSDSGKVTYTFSSDSQELITLTNVRKRLEQNGFSLDDICLQAPIEMCYQQRCCNAWRRGIFCGFDC